MSFSGALTSSQSETTKAILEAEAPSIEDSNALLP
jgi:hypothetical protein